jgi:hypothetical protein
MVRSCKHGNEPLNPIKDLSFLLKIFKDCVSLSQLFEFGPRSNDLLTFFLPFVLSLILVTISFLNRLEPKLV